jgi:hypothetical protein
MDENKPKNIFEAAGKAKKPSPSKSVPSSPHKKEEAARQPNETVSINPTQLLDLHRDPEINEMLNKMYRMQEDFQGKLSEVYEKAGISPRQIRNFLDNPGNFSPEVWQRIQGQRESLEKRINEVLKLNIKKIKSGQILGVTAGGKERKSKTLGARKNWIPM